MLHPFQTMFFTDQLVPTSHDLSARCNLDSFLECTMPTVQCQLLPKSSLRTAPHSRRASETEGVPFYTLGDLWASFDEWSAYGAGVPISLPSGETVLQYYVPYLSALQLYENSSVWSQKRRLGDDSDLSDADSRESSSEASSDTEGDKLSRSDDHLKCAVGGQGRENSDGWRTYAQWEESDGVSSEESCQNRSHLIFEFFERCAPYGRAPLSDKIAELATGFPKLKQWRSIELSSASWVSVAWYPIYCIPTGPTLRDMAACFLTFHSLSMPFQESAPELGNNSMEATETTDNSWEIASREAGDREESESKNKTASSTPRTRTTTMDASEEGESIMDDARDQIRVAKPCRVGGGNKIELPAFGLACYKLRGGLWNLERRRLISLAHSADAWLKSYNVRHPDFDFFTSRSGFLSKR